MNKTFTFNYSIVYTLTNEVLSEESLDVTFTEDDIKELAEIMKQNGGYELPLIDMGSLDMRLGEAAMEVLPEKNIDEDLDWDHLTVKFEDRLPEDFLEAINAYVPEFEVTIDYYYHVGEKEKKVSVDWMMPRCYFDKMKAVALSPLNGMTPIDNMNKVDPTVVHAVNYYCLEKITPEMVEGINEGEEPYLKDFPWQIYEHLA